MAANSNTLRQNAQGKWKLSLYHTGKSSIVIPAKFKYAGIPVAFNITSTLPSDGVDTGWKTELGVPIDFYNDVERVYTPYTEGNKRYKVRMPEKITVTPYQSGGGEPETPYLISNLLPNSINCSGGNVTLTIESNVSWTISDNSGLLSYSTSAGTGDKTVTVRVPAYSSQTTDRSFSIIVTGQSGLTETEELTQIKASGGGGDSGRTVDLYFFTRYMQKSDGTWSARYWLDDAAPDGVSTQVDFSGNGGKHTYANAGKDVREVNNLLDGVTTEIGYMTRFWATPSNFTYQGTTYRFIERRIENSYNVYSEEYGEGYLAPIKNKSSYSTLQTNQLDFSMYYGSLRDLSDNDFSVDSGGNITAKKIYCTAYFQEGTSAETYSSAYKKENMVRKFIVENPDNLALGFFRDVRLDVHRTKDFDLLIYDSRMNNITSKFKKVKATYNDRPPVVIDNNLKTGYLYMLKDGMTLEPGTYQITLQ